MEDEKRIIKGSFIFTKEKGSFEFLENHFIVINNGKIEEVRTDFPPMSEGMRTEEFDGIIIPGFVDLHLHAAQFENIGLGMDEELLPWLNKYTFPEEAKFADAEYAKDVYGCFIGKLRQSGTARSVVFGTVHIEATEILFELFEKSGLGAYVGKVCMDRNANPELTEEAASSVAHTEELLVKYREGGIVKPIITPRFAPSCSKGLLEELGRLAEEYAAPVQSHLSENRNEIKWVSELFPEQDCYARVYEDCGLFGHTPTVMAHCVHCDKTEASLIKERGVFVAHCPVSNSNVASGIAPVKDFLSMGIKTGLGSDISGGHTLWMPDVIVHAMQLSKIKAAELSAGEENVMASALSLSEAFYMATKGGGSFFGSVGSFEKGYEFDALFIDDKHLAGKKQGTLEERLSRFIYTGGHECIKKMFVAGKEV